ncbi:hypothetical protein CC80DRAFT_501811 [Byssothecium circinans]|uniref:Uncharacterized protein n=1 Tax=Byssothecium circinans TaxID=147558 RepID=A0A6A5U5L7_9PLEO|nr:hypothetical protein CC80DRAFT_501811 [Byssothecium circinans]
MGNFFTKTEDSLRESGMNNSFQARVEDDPDEPSQTSNGRPDTNHPPSSLSIDQTLTEALKVICCNHWGALSLIAIFEAKMMLSMFVDAMKAQIMDFGDQLRDALSDAIAAIKKFDIPGKAREAKKWMKEHPKETAIIAACIIIPIVCAALTPVVLGGLGFTASGVAAGSIAAGIQAGIGNVAVGSLFALLTSAGMGGFGVPIVIGTVFGASALGCGGLAVWNKYRGKSGGGASDNEGDGGPPPSAGPLLLKDEEEEEEDKETG